MITDFENFPPLDWAKVDQNLKLEGTFMFGGQLMNGEPCGDLYILRETKRGLTWSLGSNLTNGTQPEPRFDHQMTRLRENLVVFGGRNRINFIKTVYLLDLCTLNWCNIALKSEEGSNLELTLDRAEFSCAGSRQENKIFIFGGIDENFLMTNKVLVLEFDQLVINPLLNEQYQNNYHSTSDAEKSNVNLDFFSLPQTSNPFNDHHH